MFEEFTRDHPRGAKPGTIVRSGAQTFIVAATQLWSDGDTSKPMGLVWRSNCAACGTEFYQHSPTHPKGLIENCPFCASERYDRHDYVAPESGVGAPAVKRRGRIETRIIEAMHTFTDTVVPAAELIERATGMLDAPAKGKRDTRRQVVARALYNLSREKGGPLRLVGDRVIFFE